MKRPKFKILNFHIEPSARMTILRELRKLSNIKVYCAGSMFEAIHLTTLVQFNFLICGPTAIARKFLKQIKIEEANPRIVVLDLKKKILKIKDGQSIYINSIELLIETVRAEIDPITLVEQISINLPIA